MNDFEKDMVQELLDVILLLLEGYKDGNKPIDMVLVDEAIAETKEIIRILSV